MMEMDVEDVGEVEGSSGGVRGALQLQLRLLDSGGAPVFDSGEGAANVDEEVAADDQGREGMVVRCLD